jgi:SAM-dependent methyltransferase
MNNQHQSSYWDNLAPVGLDAAVIDPNDRRGHKNRYLAALRNVAVLEALARAPDGPVLDFGCGTGSLTEAVVTTGRLVLGVDISPGLIRRSRERSLGKRAICLLYDGHHVPVVDRAFSAVTTYVVLTHIVRNADLSRSLAECFRSLQPGGLLIAAEQVRSDSREDQASWKRQRSVEEYLSMIREAGFEPIDARLLRHGRSPWVQLARFGLWSQRLRPLAFHLERTWSRLLGPVNWDYADAMIIARKPLYEGR